jgi:hypothetical protein
MTKFDGDQFTSFEINDIALEFFRDHQPLRNLSWESHFPGSLESFWRGIPAHDLYSVGHGDGFRIRKSLEERADAKPMVAMTMCNVDGCQVLASCSDPICKSVGLLES